MQAIRTYNNTKCELEISKNRLNLLMDKKEALYCKYFPITSKIKEMQVDGHSANQDKMNAYLQELTKVNKETGLSLNQELEELRNDVTKLQYYLNVMEYNLNQLTGIEVDLYKEIVLNNINISKAVDKIAEKYKKEPVTVWTYYYPKIKKEIKKLQKLSKV